MDKHAVIEEKIRVFVNVPQTASADIKDGATAQVSYNAQGQTSQQTDPDGIVTSYAYDGKGQQTTVTVGGRITQTIASVAQHEPGGKTVQRTVTNVSAPVGNGLITIAEVDQTPNGRDRWQTYYGLPTQMHTDPNAPTASRTETVTRPDGSKQIAVYTQGRQTSALVLDANSVPLTSTSFDDDEFGRLQTATDARNGATTYTYTDLDEILTVAAPGGQSTKGITLTVLLECFREKCERFSRKKHDKAKSHGPSLSKSESDGPSAARTAPSNGPSAHCLAALTMGQSNIDLLDADNSCGKH